MITEKRLREIEDSLDFYQASCRCPLPAPVANCMKELAPLIDEVRRLGHALDWAIYLGGLRVDVERPMFGPSEIVKFKWRDSDWVEIGYSNQLIEELRRRQGE